ncbi:hypothetical protein [Candidatus Magnetaquicoccus inordinatus]|uniref:hypothetical protein n=1 Tax=Candidatus Magnetaquicoccus inordinatus TaxID=2496818 RepID=UPI00102B41FD|nr:hypothetical protein [Candidatus Magnetaquicoccus inordinatus]
MRIITVIFFAVWMRALVQSGARTIVPVLRFGRAHAEFADMLNLLCIHVALQSFVFGLDGGI